MNNLEKWRKGKKIGRGYSGNVYKTYNKNNNIKGALKMINLEHSDIKVFYRETSILSTVDHPNIVKILDYGSTDSELFIITEYIHGNELLNVVSFGISEHKIKKIFKQICKGIYYCHNHDPPIIQGFKIRKYHNWEKRSS